MKWVMRAASLLTIYVPTLLLMGCGTSIGAKGNQESAIDQVDGSAKSLLVELCYRKNSSKNESDFLKSVRDLVWNPKISPSWGRFTEPVVDNSGAINFDALFGGYVYQNDGGVNKYFTAHGCVHVTLHKASDKIPDATNIPCTKFLGDSRKDPNVQVSEVGVFPSGGAEYLKSKEKNCRYRSSALPEQATEVPSLRSMPRNEQLRSN